MNKDKEQIDKEYQDDLEWVRAIRAEMEIKKRDQDRQEERDNKATMFFIIITSALGLIFFAFVLCFCCGA